MMSISILILGFVVALVAALCSTPLISRFAKKKNWVDIPGNSRSMHTKETPRAGGLAIIFAFFAGLGIQYLLLGNSVNPLQTDLLVSRLAFPLGCIAIALVGLYDDAYGLGFKKKFLFQGIIAYTMFLAGFRVTIPEFLWIEDDPHLQAALGLPLTLIWYVLVMNAVNLIDGLDGLASGVSLIAMVSLTAVFGLNGDFSLVPVTVVIAGALLGFLLYNFNPASIFLGDTGSLFLGFLLATCGLEGSGHANPMLAAIIPIMAIGFPLLDTVVAFLRRIFSGLSPFAPDKDHIHHRLTGRFSLSVKAAVVRLYMVNILLGVAAVGLMVLDTVYAVLTIAGVCLLLGMWLRSLGYLNLKDGMQTTMARIKTLSSKRVPRGEWTPEPLGEETQYDIESKRNEIIRPAKPGKIAVEKREHQKLAIQTLD